jgi:1L-myo-inositol 1-phosphate cytidylyltransferase
MLRSHLDRLSNEEEFVVNHVVNEAWRSPNGMSVLKARSALVSPFLLLMSDHLFDPEIVRALLSEGECRDGVVLAIDANLSNPLVDLEDVTRVDQENGLIRNIGKGLKRYNAFDTGIFLCTPALFDALERSIERDGEASLTGGIRVLAESRRALTREIGGRFWLDVDDSRAYVKAEVALEQMRGERERGERVPPANRDAGPAT